MVQNLYKTDSRFQKPYVEICWNSMGYTCLKTTFLHLKHYLQIYLTLLSTDLWFRKWHVEYEKFPPEHLKVSKLEFWLDPLIQSWKSMSSIHRGVICDENEEWHKIWRGIGLSFKSWHEEFDKFWLEHSKVSKIFTLIGSFWAKYILFNLKKVHSSYLSWNWRGIQNLERNRFVVSRLTQGIRPILTWTNFDLSLKNFHFNRLLSSKVYIV